ncbi:uncharacterized protein BO97DRAFT_180959 [Aspergillus homomorphus CBS 101889]|uniref:Uncharacterized protein n=1 Tax=Aspergillus homomorphus (strain CBS 101889) TaxID=1450537 RepID=A0A395I7I6_ASPHC|nr:hypothetical protein BO97DRAFT_180959 [Aspergillus homomorphus CBS 101889]RAL16077.1 hypothetical protein BO97DRAFT_180959 [Aspergillus homomorphus CBS 101889]
MLDQGVICLLNATMRVCWLTKSLTGFSRRLFTLLSHTCHSMREGKRRIMDACLLVSVLAAVKRSGQRLSVPATDATIRHLTPDTHESRLFVRVPLSAPVGKIRCYLFYHIRTRCCYVGSLTSPLQESRNLDRSWTVWRLIAAMTCRELLIGAQLLSGLEAE